MMLRLDASPRVDLFIRSGSSTPGQDATPRLELGLRTGLGDATPRAEVLVRPGASGDLSPHVEPLPRLSLQG